jgi:hypothetical protein
MAKRKQRHEASMTGRAVIPQATDIDPEGVTIFPDGRVMQRTVFGLTVEQVERVRAGYTCIKCLEDYDTAFPTECMVCHFPMRDQQADEFAKDFRGDIAFGPTTTLDDEYGIAEEMIQKDAYEKARKLGLILPSWY